MGKLSPIITNTTPQFITTSIPEEKNCKNNIEEIRATELKAAPKYIINVKTAGPSFSFRVGDVRTSDTTREICESM